MNGLDWEFLKKIYIPKELSLIWACYLKISIIYNYIKDKKNGIVTTILKFFKYKQKLLCKIS